jgi:predicted Na+-dependent transporter
MAQKKKLQVFVSSTYMDLREERQAAVEAILTAGHIPAGMKLFAAGDDSQMKVISFIQQVLVPIIVSLRCQSY